MVPKLDAAEKRPYRPQSRAFVRWREEDDRPRVLTADEAGDHAELEQLTAEGITLREKREREGTLAQYLNAKKTEPEAKATWKAKQAAKATKPAPASSAESKPASTKAAP